MVVFFNTNPPNGSVGTKEIISVVLNGMVKCYFFVIALCFFDRFLRYALTVIDSGKKIFFIFRNKSQSQLTSQLER